MKGVGGFGMEHVQGLFKRANETIGEFATPAVEKMRPTISSCVSRTL
jgi:hypothetical protein